MSSSANQTILGQAAPNLPWEDRPAGCEDVVWRSARNPVIPWNHLPDANSVFNSSVAPFGDGFAGVFRVDDRRMRHRLHVGRSKDGFAWELDPGPITFTPSAADLPPTHGGYDPRLAVIDGRYYITWCNGFCGPTVGVAWTDDFQTFHLLENAFVPHNRNGVLFPRKINDRYMLLNRPSAPGHFAHGDIFLSQSPDLCFWGCHRHVMSPVRGWNDTKIGPGPAPLETDAGWLLLYHGVQTTCNGFVYRMGGAILDRDEPWKVLHRSASYLLGPREGYECEGDVPNVVFPCGLLADAATGRLAIYYGGADTCVCLAFAEVDALIAYIQLESETT